MATRHQARTAVVGLLYAYDLGNENIAQFVDDILEADKIRNKQREFSRALFAGTIEHLKELDAEIEKHLKEWRYDKIGKVEKAILRLGLMRSSSPVPIVRSLSTKRSTSPKSSPTRNPRSLSTVYWMR